VGFFDPVRSERSSDDYLPGATPSRHRLELVRSAFILALVPLLAAQQISTIRVPVRLVTLPALVFSRESRLLPGLQVADFRVLDNGRPQAITLETSSTPVSVAIAIQVSHDVRDYVPFIAKTGSALDALLVGASGEAAVVTYGSEITVVKPFDARDVQSVLRTISPAGRPARMLDAGMRAVNLLSQRPASRDRVLLFIGQPMDSGSESTLASLQASAEKANVAVYALTLPELGKAFVSDTFSLQGLSSREDRGGFKAGVDAAKLISVLNRRTTAVAATDPFSILASATGGTQFHFRKQRQLEDGIGAIGVELRSGYLLSYYPDSAEAGFHSVKIEVDIPGAKVYSRPGYWRNTD
jgi:VWFA-related protein